MNGNQEVSLCLISSEEVCQFNLVFLQLNQKEKRTKLVEKNHENRKLCGQAQSIIYLHPTDCHLSEQSTLSVVSRININFQWFASQLNGTSHCIIPTLIIYERWAKNEKQDQVTQKIFKNHFLFIQIIHWPALYSTNFIAIYHSSLL